ncbi:hypothetical protein [Sphingomonas nostoxanthinifaciens]|uniref:hypothetical protein n=1 Tax=Sphingomonas nostoxanthinifaciens TaxID=2872652 RepID=UPI001CC1E7DE|nr:hypothetical protein [Sphingomonas nostoxanthinifaciens]UAK25539.1 hypothetical protein K8P63_05090 [Sphingomonas nostoxanthinifaciens]
MGTVFTDEATRRQLLADGTLKPGSKEGSYDLTGIEFGGKRYPGVDHMDVQTTPFPAASAIGIDEPTIVTIGYGFLRQYKTVWDYRLKRIYLLAR